MRRTFVETFLLPLVRGGMVRVGKPLGERDVAAMLEDTAAAPGSEEDEARRTLAHERGVRAREILLGAADPALDETTVRLAIGVHNLLVLVHPELDGREAEQGLVATASATLVPQDAPGTVEDAVARHTVTAGLGALVWNETTVTSWMGQFRYVGRTTPTWLALVPRGRRTAIESRRRSFLRDVGVPAAARELWAMLARASPLDEALDPLRLDPPPAWERLLSALRFPALCRLASERVLEAGLGSAGDALAAALFRFAALREPGIGVAPSPQALGFGIRFLAHTSWLARLFHAGEPGPELAVLLAAAAETDARLVRPADVAAFGGDLPRWEEQLLALGERAAGSASLRRETALALCRRAASVSAPSAASPEP